MSIRASAATIQSFSPHHRKGRPSPHLKSDPQGPNDDDVWSLTNGRWQLETARARTQREEDRSSAGLRGRGGRQIWRHKSPTQLRGTLGSPTAPGRLNQPRCLNNNGASTDTKWFPILKLELGERTTSWQHARQTSLNVKACAEEWIKNVC